MHHVFYTIVPSVWYLCLGIIVISVPSFCSQQDVAKPPLSHTPSAYTVRDILTALDDVEISTTSSWLHALSTTAHPLGKVSCKKEDPVDVWLSALLCLCAPCKEEDETVVDAHLISRAMKAMHFFNLDCSKTMRFF